MGHLHSIPNRDEEAFHCLLSLLLCFPSVNLGGCLSLLNIDYQWPVLFNPSYNEAETLACGPL